MNNIYDIECKQMIGRKNMHFVTWYLVANWTYREGTAMITDEMYDSLKEQMKAEWPYIPRQKFVKLEDIDKGPTSYPKQMPDTVKALRSQFGAGQAYSQNNKGW